jgi:hypothetical protein
MAAGMAITFTYTYTYTYANLQSEPRGGGVQPLKAKATLRPEFWRKPPP